eukprot:TRINITY_DN15777_c0_g1_i1.p1 TRINITY_DN15777_c0_g1~~TRINITY_DN15777_c0_g1_i1.p1  ORF type:complete len:280 (-),score=67.00 TRINITY_DN15777_c0_g1_i1:149-988(-)
MGNYHTNSNVKNQANITIINRNINIHVHPIISNSNPNKSSQSLGFVNSIIDLKENNHKTKPLDEEINLNQDFFDNNLNIDPFEILANMDDNIEIPFLLNDCDTSIISQYDSNLENNNTNLSASPSPHRERSSSPVRFKVKDMIIKPIDENEFMNNMMENVEMKGFLNDHDNQYNLKDEFNSDINNLQMDFNICNNNNINTNIFDTFSENNNVDIFQDDDFFSNPKKPKIVPQNIEYNFTFPNIPPVFIPFTALRASSMFCAASFQKDCLMMSIIQKIFS